MLEEEREELAPRQTIDFSNADNRLLIEIWLMIYDQLIFSFGGPIGLNLQCLPLVFEAHQVTAPFDKKWLIEDLRELTRGFIKSGEKCNT